MGQKTQTRRRSQPTILGDAIAEVMECRGGSILQRYETASQMCLLLPQILPPELAQHCRVADFSGSVLTVEADSPAYMYELRMSCHQLIEHIRREHPEAGIRNIRFKLTR